LHTVSAISQLIGGTAAWGSVMGAGGEFGFLLPVAASNKKTRAAMGRTFGRAPSPAPGVCHLFDTSCKWPFNYAPAVGVAQRRIDLYRKFTPGVL
jgi:hypothetical protein